MNSTVLFSKWVVLGLKNLDSFNKRVKLVLTLYGRILMSWHDTNPTREHELPPPTSITMAWSVYGWNYFEAKLLFFSIAYFILFTSCKLLDKFQLSPFFFFGFSKILLKPLILGKMRCIKIPISQGENII